MNQSSKKAPKIGVFGHYGNQNLGDEAIIEAVIKNLRQRISDVEIVGLSINPFDTRDRYQVDTFPIRYREDFFEHGKDFTPPALKTEPKNTQQEEQATQKNQSRSLKETLKHIPIIGFLLKSLVRSLDISLIIKQEIKFLLQAKRYLKDIDLLLITGSNQFLDNFGGAWGFPYTLLKWTLLAKSCGTKVAFISVGAGPLNLPLSFKMLNIALKKADYVSYRDEGSKELIESKIAINAPIYPDIAHSLGIQSTKAITQTDELTIAVNPMPVYDSRYWHEPNEEKFQAYIHKVSELCKVILSEGYSLDLFSTQTKDENVVDDIIEKLTQHADFASWEAKIQISKNKLLSELINTLDKADIVVATRFHATVLPLQINKPVLGICYYRKAAELLDDVGLNDFHVDIDDFSEQELKEKFATLLRQRQTLAKNIEQHFEQYKIALDEQYKTIVALVNHVN